MLIPDSPSVLSGRPTFTLRPSGLLPALWTQRLKPDCGRNMRRRGAIHHQDCRVWNTESPILYVRPHARVFISSASAQRWFMERLELLLSSQDDAESKKMCFQSCLWPPLPHCAYGSVFISLMCFISFIRRGCYVLISFSCIINHPHCAYETEFISVMCLRTHQKRRTAERCHSV